MASWRTSALVKTGGRMCEAKVYLEKDGKLEELMENVVTIKPEGDKLLLMDIFGEQKLIKGSLVEVRLLDHKVVLKESPD